MTTKPLEELMGGLYMGEYLAGEVDSVMNVCKCKECEWKVVIAGKRTAAG